MCPHTVRSEKIASLLTEDVFIY